MADKEVKVIIRGDAGSAIAATTSICDRLKEMMGLTSATNRVMSLLGSAWGANKLAQGFNAGLNAVDEFQQSVAKTAALITSLQGGDDFAANYGRARDYATGLQEELQKVDARTTLNLSNLQTITEEMTKQGVILDYNNKAQIDAFTQLANAGAVYSNNGQREAQLRQEISALLRGEVNMNSQLASMIQRQVDGPLQKQVEQWKQSGTFLQEVAKYLKGFGPASDDLAKTWGAVKSSMETAINVVLRAGFASIVRDVADQLNKVNEYLKGHKTEIAAIISNGWEKFKDTASLVWDTLKLLQPVLSFVSQHIDLIVIGLSAMAAGNIINGVAALVVQFQALKTAAVAAAAAVAAGGIASLGTGGVIGLAAGLTALTAYAGKKLGESAGMLIYGDDIAANEARGAVADKKLASLLAARQSNKAQTPKLNLGQTQEQIKEAEKLADLRLKIQETMDKTELDRLKSSGKIKADILKDQWERGQVSMRDYYASSVKTAQDTMQKELDMLDKRKSQIQNSYGKAKDEDRRLQLQNELKQVEGQREQLLNQYGQSRLNILQQAQEFEEKSLDQVREHTTAAEELRREYEEMLSPFPQLTGFFDQIAGKQRQISDLERSQQVLRGQGHFNLVAAISNEIEWLQKQIDKTRELATEELKSLAFKTGSYALIAEAELAEAQGNKQLADALKAEIAARTEVKRVEDEIKKSLQEQDAVVRTLADTTRNWTDAESSAMAQMIKDLSTGIEKYRELLDLRQQALQQSGYNAADARMGLSRSDNYLNSGSSGFGLPSFQNNPGAPWSNTTNINSLNVSVQSGDSSYQTGNNVALGTVRGLETVKLNSFGG